LGTGSGAGVGMVTVAAFCSTGTTDAVLGAGVAATTAGALGVTGVGDAVDGAGSGGKPSFGGIWMEISCEPDLAADLFRSGSESKIIGKKTMASKPIVTAPIKRRLPRRLISNSAAEISTALADAILSIRRGEPEKNNAKLSTISTRRTLFKP
jgi:hypothetical protein